MVKKLLPLIADHRVYVEPFGGGASLLFSKEPSPVEVYNDLDSGLVNFFRVLRDRRQFKRLQFLASLTPYAREEFEWALQTWRECANPADKAHRWFIVARMSFSGRFGASWGFSVTSTSRRMASSVSSYLSAVEHLPNVCDRLLRVQIEHAAALQVIRTYDTKETLFYVDPPYVHSTRRSGGYLHEMADDDHRELVDLLLSVKGRVILSGYSNPLYLQLEKRKWHRIDWQTDCSASGTRQTALKGEIGRAERRRVESVWMNYVPNQAA